MNTEIDAYRSLQEHLNKMPIGYPATQSGVEINLARCFGCGLCVTIRPNNAIVMVKKEQETVPPETNEDLLDQILEEKKSRQ